MNQQPAIPDTKKDSIRMMRGARAKSGFALVVAVLMLILLSTLAVGLLSLSTVALRGSSQGSAKVEAQANARLALALAIGELQKEMGPDMRISCEAALFDEEKESETIEGVDQPHWLACYHSWGSWLNGSYDLPDSGETLTIQNSYGPRREKMFRRWLVSLPDGMSEDVAAPLSLADWDDDNSVVMVGPGTLGDAAERPGQVTRAYRVTTGEEGGYAWWIGPENHKARIDLAKEPRTQGNDEWEVTQGDTAEVGVGALDGFGVLDDDSELGRRLVTRRTLATAGVDDEKVKGSFYDLTAFSEGVLASVRTGHLKKDLSLLFEKSNGLPESYEFVPGRSIREPSIRPMSEDLQAKNPTIPDRHFASWTNLRHFYRMYRSDSDATEGETGSGSLNWFRSKPWSDLVSTTSIGRSNPGWDGSNNYWRVPILAKLTFIYSLQAVETGRASGQFDCYLVYTPVFTFWNPYNTELQIPDEAFGMLTAAYKILPYRGELYVKNLLQSSTVVNGPWAPSYLRSGTGGNIVFQPGEMRVFSHNHLFSDGTFRDLHPGFDPQAIGGSRIKFGTFAQTDDPGLSLTFSYSEWGGNVNFGNTPGSLCHTPFWKDNERKMPTMYQHDWLQQHQTLTRITPDPGLVRGVATRPGNLGWWTFGDSSPLPFAYSQLVLKGLSEFDYESIEWASDWRSRNWIHAPPFYFGSAQYISEDPEIANTQRLDNPYTMNFGPMSMLEMPNVVFQTGDRAYLGSGSYPFERVSSVAAIELPTAPISSLAGFSGMRINPGWLKHSEYGSDLKVQKLGSFGPKASLYSVEAKAVAYQSGITGPGIGNSFIHPMLSRDEVYRYLDNSKSQDPTVRTDVNSTETVDNKMFNDYWDHVFLINDALWDDYFVSSLADQTRPGASAARSLDENIERLISGDELANSRYRHYSADRSTSETETDLKGDDNYLKVAGHLMVDGMFNVNSTSVAAWQALFSGIRERQLVYRDSSGSLKPINVPSGKRIAISRFNTEISDVETDDIENGVSLGNGNTAWTGVRYLDDEQLLKLAEECVKQVKLRGPFLNFSEFINRRLSNDELGIMGALQSAIDYDDASPDPSSINYRFKSEARFMINENDLGDNEYGTPEAVEGSRFAGIPGYVIQSDILKPISNTLAVRDDTFRIRAYGEATDANGNVTARAWCEAVVQRMPDYCDPSNDPEVPAYEIDENGSFVENGELNDNNRRFGRQFRVQSFSWLNSDEV